MGGSGSDAAGASSSSPYHFPFPDGDEPIEVDAVPLPDSEDVLAKFLADVGTDPENGSDNHNDVVSVVPPHALVEHETQHTMVTRKRGRPRKDETREGVLRLPPARVARREAAVPVPQPLPPQIAFEEMPPLA